MNDYYSPRITEGKKNPKLQKTWLFLMLSTYAFYLFVNFENSIEVHNYPFFIAGK